MTNSADPDKVASSGAGSTLFDQICLSENLGSFCCLNKLFICFISSSLKTKDVIAALLKKFHILDHPRKFALYEQELRNNKIGKNSQQGKQ